MLARASRTIRFCGLALICTLAACGDAPPPPADTAASPDERVAAAPAPVAPAEVPPPPPQTPHQQFWSRLSALCGNAYAGYLTIGTEDSDRAFGEAELKMHVKDCLDDEIRIPFHVGDNRSRTFIVRRDGDTLTLHHRHLDENGEIDEPHGYGGATQSDGSARRQEFVVDDATKAKLPETRYNVWALEVVPGQMFAYELQRPEEDRFFRVEFDLAETIDTPPPPWGER